MDILFIALGRLIGFMLGQGKRKQEPTSYYEVRLTPAQRVELAKLLDGNEADAKIVVEVRNAVIAAREYDIPPAEVAWDDWEGRAERRGSTLPDLLFDAPWKAED